MRAHSKTSRVSWVVAAILVLGATGLVGCAASKEAMAPGPPPDDSVPIRADVKDFILGPGDEIDVMVWRFPDLTRTARVSTHGEIQLPLAGDVRVTGLSAFELRDVIAERLSGYITDPQVTVSVRTLRSQKLFVLGEVRRPGVFPIEPDVTALDAIGKAGDFNLDAKQAEVLLIRKGEGSKTVIYPLNLEKALKEGDFRQNPRLTAGDVIYVPPTTMVEMSRFALRLTAILSPLIAAEAAFLGFEDIVIKWPFTQDVLEGNRVVEQPATTIVIPPFTTPSP
jgi:polysaccharide export outer membrane protein